MDQPVLSPLHGLDAESCIHLGYHRTHTIAEHFVAQWGTDIHIPTAEYLLMEKKPYKFRITVIQLIGAPVVTSL